MWVATLIVRREVRDAPDHTRYGGAGIRAAAKAVKKVFMVIVALYQQRDYGRAGAALIGRLRSPTQPRLTFLTDAVGPRTRLVGTGPPGIP
jgi:hypothetical protein